jgi:hypothetical protein
MISSLQITEENAGSARAAAVAAATKNQEGGSGPIKISMDQGTLSVSTRDGQLLGTSRQSSASFNTAELIKGDGISLLSTARTSMGSPTTEYTKNTLVAHGGMEITLQTAEQLGLVKQVKGEWVDVAPEDQPKETEAPEQEEAQGFDDNTEMALGALVETIPPQMQTSVIESVIRQGLEATNLNDLAYNTGQNVEELRGRIGAAEVAFREQANKALIGAGLSREEIPAFCKWAQEKQPDAFTNAQRKHVYERSTKDYAPLAAAWMRSTPPVVSSLDENLKARTVQGETLVTPPGHPEMLLATAARLGLI